MNSLTPPVAPKCPPFLPSPHFEREELWPESAGLDGWLQGAEEVAPWLLRLASFTRHREPVTPSEQQWPFEK